MENLSVEFEIYTNLSQEKLVGEIENTFEDLIFERSERFDEFQGFDGVWKGFEFSLMVIHDKLEELYCQLFIFFKNEDVDSRLKKFFFEKLNDLPGISIKPMTRMP